MNPKLNPICLLFCLYANLLMGQKSTRLSGSSEQKRNTQTALKSAGKKTNIILIMSDDQGWGQTGYYGHPILKTPNLDSMAMHGLRMDRFYAGAPVCSPTRASVLTGRSNDRSAVYSVGYPMRRQEKTIAQALKNAGYHTAHFGKWHLDGLKGAGVPILESDDRNPGYFGFDDWLSVSNFFDMDPLMSRKGKFESFTGGSSTVIVSQAIEYIQNNKDKAEPFFIAIWYGSPHSPWSALAADKLSFTALDKAAQDHYGELVEMDRSIGALRKALRDLAISDNTLVWFNSDNGGLKNFGPETVGNLRGFKGDIYEGGIRVPCIIEWPAVIKAPRISAFPAVTMDIFPTLAEIAGLPVSGYPLDGISIRKLFTEEMGARNQPIPFRYVRRAALIDNQYKLLTNDLRKNEFELYDLQKDPHEKNNLIFSEPVIAGRMLDSYRKWSLSVDNSIAGKDYPNGLMETDPAPRSWLTAKEYAPFLEVFMKRPEYKNLKAGDDKP